MQGRAFQTLTAKTHPDDLVMFYSEKDIRVELLYLCQFRATFNDNKVIVHKGCGGVVHMGRKSAQYHSGRNPQYRIGDYEKSETIAHYQDEVHDYELAETVLEAELLINFCKTKQQPWKKICMVS